MPPIQYLADDGINFINVSEDTPLPVAGAGGGGGGGEVEVTNFPATQVVSGTVTATGPLTNAQFTAVMGTAATAAWNGTDANATVIGILKALHPILNLTMMEVSEIDQDMDTVKAELIAINTNTASG